MVAKWCFRVNCLWKTANTGLFWTVAALGGRLVLPGALVHGHFCGLNFLNQFFLARKEISFLFSYAHSLSGDVFFEFSMQRIAKSSCTGQMSVCHRVLQFRVECHLRSLLIGITP